MAQAEKILCYLRDDCGLTLDWQSALIGGSAYDVTGVPLPEETVRLAQESDAVLLGAIGGVKWNHLDRELRPERGLLAIRQQLGLFANLRPAVMYEALVNVSSLRPEKVSGLDIVIVRELTGGIYFGQPRGIRRLPDNTRQGFNTLVYSEQEIERIARTAFEVAVRRNGHLCSVDKANVLEVSELWREVVSHVAVDYPGVALQHMYVDNAAMQLVREPRQFDVILTSNLFGDILSDLAAMLTGSIGMLPSASLHGDFGLYEPVHGSAPDIAGQDKANPLSMILSLSLLLRYSLNEEELAARIENAVSKVLVSGVRTADICVRGQSPVGTAAMGDAVLDALRLP